MSFAKEQEPGRLLDLFQSIQDPVFLTTTDGVILDVNRAAAAALGKDRDVVVGAGICQIIHGGRWPHIECPLEEFLRTCGAKSENTRLPGLGGEYLLIVTPLTDPAEQVVAMMLQARKLTREEALQVETIRTAQLAAIGELAASVAHEVNNPINGIINFAQLISDDAAAESLQAELSGRIVNEGERIASIIDSLLSFARENENEFGDVDIRDVVKECLSLVDHQLRKEGIILEQELSEKDCRVTGNFMQLQQVIFNAINNSRYALNERYENSSPDKKIVISCAPFEEEGYHCIRTTVRDLGTGIPQGILDKLFEPFFTTKPKGKGTGLGMSISFGIIQNHGGTLTIDSVLNNYTDIVFDIPRAGAAQGERNA